MTLDPFYFISDNSEQIAQLVPLGIKLVQLRIKDRTPDFIEQEIIKAKEICQKYNCNLVINDYWEIAHNLGCDFVHLGQEDLQAIDLEKFAQTGLKLGVSTHSLAELDFALNLPRYGVCLAYVALGAIYPTRLKKMPTAPQGVEKLQIWKEKVGTLPLVAIGGLNPERAKLCLQVGADSAAVVTDITLNDNPKKRTIEWLEATENWRNNAKS